MEQNNYFTSSIRRFNTDDFITCLKPEQIQRSAKERIFREMVNGQIDYQKFGKYFLDSKFMDNIIIAAQNELTNNTCVSTALNLYDSMYPGNPDMSYNRIVYAQRANAFTYIIDRLGVSKNTENPSYLMDIHLRLGNLKNLF